MSYLKVLALYHSNMLLQVAYFYSMINAKKASGLVGPLRIMQEFSIDSFIFHRADGVHHHVPAEELPRRRPSLGGGPRVGEGLHRLHEAVDLDRDAGKLCLELKPPKAICKCMKWRGNERLHF